MVNAAKLADDCVRQPPLASVAAVTRRSRAAMSCLGPPTASWNFPAPARAQSKLAMVPLIVMLIACLGFRIAGIAGFNVADSWIGALRFALAVMFFFTSVSHFVPP